MQSKWIQSKLGGINKFNLLDKLSDLLITENSKKTDAGEDLIFEPFFATLKPYDKKRLKLKKHVLNRMFGIDDQNL